MSKVHIGVLMVLLAVLGVSTCLKVGILHMHGLGEQHDEDRHVEFKKYIEEKSGLTVHLIDAYNGRLRSLLPLEWQVPGTLTEVKRIVQDNEYDKIIAVGYSQGGIIWRGMIESWDNHIVDTFISIASPQHGMAGAPPMLKYYIPNIDKLARDIDFYKYVYGAGQWKSVFNYWLDPNHYEYYLDKADFFPKLNNEKGTDEEKAKQKDNFLKLRKLVLVGGPDEDVLRPRESAQFGYYTEKGTLHNEVIPMEETRFYKEDLFGLKTLDERGGIVMCTVAGPDHIEFSHSEEVMDKCVLTALSDARENAKLNQNEEEDDEEESSWWNWDWIWGEEKEDKEESSWWNWG